MVIRFTLLWNVSDKALNIIACPFVSFILVIVLSMSFDLRQLIHSFGIQTFLHEGMKNEWKNNNKRGKIISFETSYGRPHDTSNANSRMLFRWNNDFNHQCRQGLLLTVFPLMMILNISAGSSWCERFSL